MEDTKTKEVKLSPSIHLSFQAFEPIDLPFDLSLAPRQRTRRISLWEAQRARRLVEKKAADAWEQSPESGGVVLCWLEAKEEAACATAW